MTPPIFCCRPPASAGVSKEATGADRGRPTCQEAAALRRRRKGPRDRNPTSEGGDKRNGKEDSQGREEKGRQEAVAASPVKKGAAAAPFFLYDVSWLADR